MQKYADEHHFFNTRFFADDGFSGVSFEREGLQEMLREVEAGNVATVITKDLNQLDRICEALGCSLSELLEYILNQQPRTGENLIFEEHGNSKKRTR